MKRRKRSKEEETYMYFIFMCCALFSISFNVVRLFEFWVWSLNVSMYGHLCVHIRTES